MQEHPDDDLPFEGFDRLFRKSAEEFESPYDPAAWQLMQAKLDEHDRVVFWGRILRWSLALMALLVLISGSWYNYKQRRQNETSARIEQPTERQQSLTERANLSTRPGQSKESLAEVKSVSDNKPRSEPKELIRSPSVNDRSESILQTLPKSTNSSTSKTSQSVKAVAPVRPNGERTRLPDEDLAGRQTMDQPMRYVTRQRRRLSGSVVRHFSSSKANRLTDAEQPTEVQQSGQSEQSVAVRANKKQTIALKSDQAMPPPATNLIPARHVANPDAEPPTTDAIGIGAGNQLSESTTDVAQTGSEPPYRIGTVDALSSRGLLRWPQWPMLTIPALAQPDSPTATRKPQMPPEKGLNIRFIFSPDISSIGIQNFTKPGTNFGFLAEYQISRRWAIQAGVIQSRKIYKAMPDQYVMPTGWRWAVMPIGINGQCKMLDVPINLRYNLLLLPMGEGRAPARWFLSSGVTTYIMKNERYDYTFANPNDPRIRYRYWEGNTGQYRFSNLNLSVGYERPIGRRLAWQVEPFVKMPLQGIGQFKVRLFSTGVFGSIRYRIW